MPALDPRTHLQTTTRNVFKRLVNDLQAIPEDKQNVAPGGDARAPLHYVAECAAVNGFIAQFLTTGQMPKPLYADPAEREKFLSSFDTQEKTLAFLTEQTEALIAAFQEVDPETLGDTTDALFGRPMTRFAIAEMPAMHMSYHDGQLCQNQMFHGDRQMHWD